MTENKITDTAIEMNNDTSISSAASNLAKEADTGFNNNVKGFTWGSDLASNIANGLKSATSIGKIAASSAAVASCVSDYLHHSVPEKGPLKNDDEWMPDMIKNFTTGIKNNTPKIQKKIKGLAKQIEDGLDLTKLYNKMQATVEFETAKLSTNLSTKATLEIAKDQPKTVTNDNGVTIHNTQQFYSKNATPYEEQKQAKQQLRRLAYGL